MKIPNSNIQNTSVKVIKSSGNNTDSAQSTAKTSSAQDRKLSTADRAAQTQQSFIVKDVQKLSSQDIQRLRQILSDEQLSKTLKLSRNELASLKSRADFEKLSVNVARVTAQNTNRTTEQNGATKKNNQPVIFITRENISKGQSIKLSNQTLETHSNNTALASTSNLTVTQQKTLTEALRHYLPNQQALNVNLKDLSTLHTALNSLEGTTKNKLLGENTIKSLDLVLKNILTAKTEIKPEALIQRLKHSGIFLESNLKANLSSSAPLPKHGPTQAPTQQPGIINQNISPTKPVSVQGIQGSNKNVDTAQAQTLNTLPLKKTESEALIPRVATTSKPLTVATTEKTASTSQNAASAIQSPKSFLSNSIDQTAKNSAPPNLIGEQDLKSALLQLLLSLGVNPALPMSQTSSKTSHAIDALIQAFLLPSKNQDQQKKALANIQEAIKNLTLSTLSRLVTLQLQNRHRQAADRGITSSQILEIPMKIGDHWTPLTLHIEQQDYLSDRKQQEHAANGDDQKKTKSKRTQWNVFLEFSFPDDSVFSCEINVVDNTVTSSLWAENLEMRKSLSKRLPELEQELKKLGIDVDTLRCINNKPVRQANTIQQNIVDIKT